MKNFDINITRRKDGRYMGKFVSGYDKNGKALYQYVYGSTYDKAKDKVLIGREVASRYLSGKCITVGKVYKEWLDCMKYRVKESTFENYRTKFEKHILPYFGNTSCTDLSAGQINTFINKKLADGLSASYVRDIFTVFKSMLRYAQEEYNFSLSLKNVVLPKTEKKKIEKISNAEQKKLTTYLKEHISITAFGILISLMMGLRIGELCGLKWEDVDFRHKTLHIRRTIQRISTVSKEQKTKIFISTPKSDTSFRTIAIPNQLMKYFEMFRNKGDFFILSGSDKPVEPRTMQYRYKKILKEADVNDYNYHRLRHTFATNCAEKGCDVKTLSVVLGHSTVNVTLNRYIHPDHSHERHMMNRMCMQI